MFLQPLQPVHAVPARPFPGATTARARRRRHASITRARTPARSSARTAGCRCRRGRRPKPGSSNAEPYREGANHPTPVHPHVAQPDRTELKDQHDEEPRAEHGGRDRRPRPAERERHPPEGEREQPLPAESEWHPPEPAVERELPLQEPTPQLERCAVRGGFGVRATSSMAKTRAAASSKYGEVPA